MKIIAGVLPFVLIWGGPAAALTYQWPTIVGAEWTSWSSLSGIMSIQTSVLTIDDPRITEQTTVRDVLGINGKRMIDDYAVIPLYYRTNDSDPHYVHRNILGGPSSFGADSRWIDLTRSFAWSGTYTLNVINAPQNICVGTAVWTARQTSMSPNEFSTSAFDPTGAICYKVPPVGQWCALTVPTITFSYGTMTLTNAANATLTQNARVECSAGMKYTLRLRGGQTTIPLSNGMESKIRAMGLELGSTLNGAAGNNVVPLSSTLQGTAQKSGAFSGTGVLYVTYP